MNVYKMCFKERWKYLRYLKDLLKKIDNLSWIWGNMKEFYLGFMMMN